MTPQSPDPPAPLPEPPGDEPVEQHELRRKLEEEVEEARKHRTGAEEPGEEAGTPSAATGWEPPPDAVPDTRRGRPLVRLLVLLVLAGALWVGGRWVLGSLFGPELEAVRAVVPSGIQPAHEPARLGILFRNTGSAPASGFAVAVRPEGRETEGVSVDVPPGDSALATVDVRLETGDQVVALIAFDDTEEVRRLETFSGLAVQVREHHVVVDDVVFPAEVRRGDTIAFELTTRNLGPAATSVRAVVHLVPDHGGAPTRVQGEVVEMEPGGTRRLAVPVDTGRLEAGRHVAEVEILTPAGRRVGATEVTSPLRVTGS